MLYTFGDNSFRIYKYPSIKRGHSVGILGGNGLGKSTILKILSNQIQINKKNFSGDEMYKYISDIDNITVAYKPQDIEIYRNDNKFVRDYIKEHNFSDSEYIAKFQIKNLVDRQLSQLSGGELQRLLIAQVCSKKADSYIL
jgi:ATP-binding cassette subfamily E protein 1